MINDIFVVRGLVLGELFLQFIDHRCEGVLGMSLDSF